MSGMGGEWDGIEEEFGSPDDDIERQEASFGDGASQVPDPEDTVDPVDAIMRLCVRIDPRNPLHEKIYLWASRLPTDKRGLSNIGAHIIQALNRYLDDNSRPVSDSVFSRSMGPARFAELSKPAVQPSNYRGAAADRLRYRENLRQRQEKLSNEDISIQEPHLNDGGKVNDGVSSPERPVSESVSEIESVAVKKGSTEAVDYSFLPPDIYDDKKSEW